MPALRKRLRQPGTYLLVLAAIGVLPALDVFRPPQQQVSAAVYLTALDMYQQYGRDALKDTIRCRYVPTCSEYSREAVQRFGMVGGISLTFSRVRSCTTEVKPGKIDPVPIGRPRHSRADTPFASAANTAQSRWEEGNAHEVRVEDDR